MRGGCVDDPVSLVSTQSRHVPSDKPNWATSESVTVPGVSSYIIPLMIRQERTNLSKKQTEKYFQGIERTQQ